MTESAIAAPPTELPEDLELSGAPIVITYYITSEFSVQTTVLGEARNAVNVSLMAGSIPLWSGSLTQALPEAKTTFPVVVGNLEIKEGATLKLTIPTGGPTPQPGQVFFQCKIVAQGTERPFSAPVATWNLN